MKKINVKLILTSTTIFVLAGICFTKFIGYLYRIILSRLGPTQYGTFVLALSIILFSLIIAKLGLDSGIQRYLPYFKAKKSYNSIKKLIKISYLTTFVSSLIIAIFVYLISPYLAILFNNQNLEKALKILVWVIPIAALSFLTLTSLKSLYLGKKAVISQYFIERTFLIITAIVLTSISFTLQSALYAYLLASLLTLVTSSLFLLKPLKKIFHKAQKSSNFKIRELINYSIPLMFAGATYLIIRYIDIILVGFFLDSTNVGFYDIAVLGAISLFIIPESTLYLFTPQLSKAIALNRKKQFLILMKRATRSIVIINSIISIPIILFSSFFIKLFLGSSYIASSLPLSILAVGMLIRTYFLPKTTALSVTKNTRTVFKIDLISAICNIAFNLLLISSLGLLGAAIGTSLSYIIMGLLTNYYYKSKVNI